MFPDEAEPRAGRLYPDLSMSEMDARRLKRQLEQDAVRCWVMQRRGEIS